MAAAGALPHVVQRLDAVEGWGETRISLVGEPAFLEEGRGGLRE